MYKKVFYVNELSHHGVKGMKWGVRRELTNTEWLEIDRRKRDGEKLADILDSMKVLK